MKKKSSREKKFVLGLYIFVMTCLVTTVVYLIVKFIMGDFTDTNGTVIHSRGDYLLMLLQCLLGVVVINIPSFLERKFKVQIPTFLVILYLIFLHCAIYLGEVRSFYYRVKYWDSILHFMSSLMTGFFGFLVIDYLNNGKKTLIQLSPFFVALFAFCFACMIGCLWEIYEFIFDKLLGLNMQKFMTYDGQILIGQAALTDTMKDLIINSIGALIASSVGHISLKKKNYWLFKTTATVEKNDIKSDPNEA